MDDWSSDFLFDFANHFLVCFVNLPMNTVAGVSCRMASGCIVDISQWYLVMACFSSLHLEGCFQTKKIKYAY